MVFLTSLFLFIKVLICVICIEKQPHSLIVASHPFPEFTRPICICWVIILSKINGNTISKKSYVIVVPDKDSIFGGCYEFEVCKNMKVDWWRELLLSKV